MYVISPNGMQLGEPWMCTYFAKLLLAECNLSLSCGGMHII